MAKQAGVDNAAEATVPKSAQDAFGAILEAENPTEEETQNQDTQEEEEAEEETSGSDEEENPDESDDEEEEEEAGEEEETEETTAEKLDIEKLDLDQALIYKEQELTLREVLDGGLRQSDYSRKTAELADQRKAFIEHETAVKQERAEYAKRLEKLDAAIEAVLPVEPTKEEWDKLRRENPTEYAARKADMADAKEKLQAIRAEKERVADQETADQATKYNEYLAHEHTELLSKLPEWKDNVVATKEQAELVQEAKNRGFTDDELALVDNHRIILLLRDAMMYRQLQGQKPLVRKKAKGSPVVKPGTTKRPKTKKGKTQSAREHLKKVGSIPAAADVFLAGLEEEDRVAAKR